MEGFVIAVFDLHVPLLHKLGTGWQQESFTELFIPQFAVS